MLPPINLSSLLSLKLSGASWVEQENGQSSSRVFRLDWPDRPSLYVKWGTERAAEAIIDEFARLEWLSGKVPAPKIEHFESERQNACLLSSAISGVTADQFLTGRQKDLMDVIAAIAKFLRLFHQIEAKNCPFDASRQRLLRRARENIDSGYVDTTDFDAERLGWTAEQVWDALIKTQPNEEEYVVTHGDFTLDNILIADGQVIGCIDVGRLGVGDRYRDIATFWRSLRKFGEIARRQFLTEYGIDDIDQRRLEFHLLLDEFF